MSTKIATKRKRQRTTMVPVTTMEEIPILNDEERDTLRASLKEAESQIKAGRAVEYNSKKFKSRFMSVYRRAKRAKR